MRKTKNNIICTVLLMFCLTGISIAADVLDIGAGARSIGLGRTNTSVKGDAYGIFGNPASLRGVTTGEIVSMYGTMNTDVKYTLLGYVLPTKYGKFFAGYANNQTPDITSTTLDATTGRPVAVTNFDFRNDMLLLGYENSLSKAISYGLRVKYYNKGSAAIANMSGSGVNADAGVQIDTNDKLTVGMIAKNIIPGQSIKLLNGQTEELPGEFDIGLGFFPHKRLDIYADLNLTRNIPAEAKVGIEWRMVDFLALRLGAEQKSMGASSSYINGSAGVGLNLGIFGIDYAYYYDSLVTTNSRHFISISIKTPAVKAAEPVFPEKTATKAISKEEVKIITPKAPAIPVEEVKAKEPEAIEYIVVEDDWLSKIALRYLGDMKRYPELAKMNDIKNPDLIFPGQKIIIKK
ncbi:MAG: LysM peptidoglycan-binding domain-containing protein [Candidatus Saganbacteria bacterium]|nr:LysM peptidoglycan-binding domain-containing protein [Candidatus Saganbacteria bacterium]